MKIERLLYPDARASPRVVLVCGLILSAVKQGVAPTNVEGELLLNDIGATFFGIKTILAILKLFGNLSSPIYTALKAFLKMKCFSK